MVGGPSASLPDSRAVQGPAGYTTCRLPTALSYAQVHRPKRPVMIAVDWLCAPGAPLIVVTGSGGELLQTALSRLARADRCPATDRFLELVMLDACAVQASSGSLGVPRAASPRPALDSAHHLGKNVLQGTLGS